MMAFDSRFVLAAIAVCIFGASVPAAAVMPDSGWYWNTGESGRGFEIEIQNNVLFMSAFMYDEQGKPIWVVAGGPMSSDHTFSAGGIQTANGQCLGCAYVVPDVVPYGPVSINFTGAASADITIKGVTIHTVRQQFGFDFTSRTSPLLGEWALVDGNTSFPIYFGERITLSATNTLNGSPWATGNRSGESGSNYIAIGNFDPTSGTWAILLDSSTSYYELFIFSFAAFDRIEGTEYVYLKTALPGAGLASIGYRIKSAAAAAGLDAPGTDKALAISANDGALRDQLAEVQVRNLAALKSSVTATPAVQQLARNMAEVLGAAAR